MNKLHKVELELLPPTLQIKIYPSDQVGFIAAIQGIDYREILFKLGVEPRYNEEPPWPDNITDLAHPSRNFEFRPKVLNEAGEFVNIDFSAERQLEAIGTDSGLWSRVVINGEGATAEMWEVNSGLRGPWPNQIYGDPRNR